jgi:hypothetical protein
MFRTIAAPIAKTWLSTKAMKIGEMMLTDSRTPRRFRSVSNPSSTNVNGIRSAWSGPGGNKEKIDSEQLASEIAIVRT